MALKDGGCLMARGSRFHSLSEDARRLLARRLEEARDALGRIACSALRRVRDKKELFTAGDRDGT
jgi:hypothetical protein